MRVQRNWIAVASAEHVRLGVAGGYMQVCHGEGAPLRRIAPGDRVVYYSPTATFQGTDRVRAFTALGVVEEGEPYAFDMGRGFVPFRRNVSWTRAAETPIASLLPHLEFSRGRRNWAYPFRFGLVAISPGDMNRIAAAMLSYRGLTEDRAGPLVVVGADRDDRKSGFAAHMMQRTNIQPRIGQAAG